MTKQRAKTRMETREFLAIVTESGEHIILDDEIVRKYRLRAGIVSPFSSQPIVSVTRTVPVPVAPQPKHSPKPGHAGKSSGKNRPAKSKSAAKKPGKKSVGKK